MENLRQFESFQEENNPEEVNEALKMMISPLMTRIMGSIGFNSDPKLKQELREEIQRAVEEVLRKHDVIVE
jgi:DNA repair photolyase